MQSLSVGDHTSVGLSPQERFTLCNDIGRFGVLIGRETEGGDGDFLRARIESQAPGSPWERLQVLANLWPHLVAALHAVVACPDSATIALPRRLPIQTARGNPAALARLARDPTDHQAWKQAIDPQTPCEPLVTVREPRPTRTEQTASNRIAADFLQALAQELWALHRLAMFCDDAISAASAERLAQSAVEWLRHAPFRDCSAKAGRDDASAARILLRCSPAYRSLYTVLRRVRSGLHIDWTDSAVARFPVLEAWHLFEIWCFLRVGVALCDLGWQPVTTDCLQIVQAGMRLRLAHGKASRIRFKRSIRHRDSAGGPDGELDLLYQPQFSSANQGSPERSAAFRSRSHVMQPDIALVKNGRMLLLDPKYRPYSEVGEEQEDVDKMHAYRDAIVRTDAATGQPVPAVDAAWCLFPGVPESASLRPERLRAYPTSTAALPFGTAGVGAVQVRPGAENAELTALLRHWLEATA